MTLLVSFAISTAIAASPGADPGRYAIVIGNNYGARGELPLQYAERDAEETAKVLNRFGRVPAENTILLLGQSASAIRSAILQLNVRIRGAEPVTPTSTLFVYYSGHAAANGLHIGEEAIAYREMRALIESSAATARVLVLDACRSGGLTAVKGGKPAPGFPVDAFIDKAVEGFALISSSAAGEDSHESDRLRASFFTHHFLNALRGAADANSDANVSLNEAYQYAFENTLRASKRTAQLQHPTFAYDLKGRKDLVVSYLGNAERTGRVVFARPGHYVITSAANDAHVVAEVTTSEPATKLYLRPDRYSVQERQTQRYVEYELDVRSGQTARIEPGGGRELAYSALVRKGAREVTSSSGLFVLPSVRSSVVDGSGSRLGADVVFGLDLQWLSIDVRFRYARSASYLLGDGLSARLQEFAPGLSVYKYFDVRPFAFGFGLRAEAGIFVQNVSGYDEQQRVTYGGALSPVVVAQLWLGGALFARVEGSVSTYLLPSAEINTGAEAESKLRTPVSAGGALGVGWMF